MEMRRTIPEKGNKFFNTTSVGGYSTCIKGKPVQNGLNVLCNCVGFACGEFNRIYSEITGYKGMKYPSLNCNAEKFIERAEKYGLEISKEPTIGGIGVFQKGSLKGVDGAGHVFIFIKDYGDGDTYDITESGYNSFAFRCRTVKKSQNYGMGSAYKFRGCIVNPAIGKKPKPEPKPEPSKEEYYKIKKGDTLSGIAKKYKTTVSAIMKLNPKIKDKNKIYAGDTIRVK